MHRAAGSAVRMIKTIPRQSAKAVCASMHYSANAVAVEAAPKAGAGLICE